MDKIKSVLTNNSVFRRSYIICLFMCNIAFVQIAAYAALAVLFLWGVFLVFYNEYKRHTILKTRYAFWLCAFLAATTLTALIHIKDNFFYNLIIELHFCICFFIFYSVHTEKRLNFRRELYSVCRFIVCFTTVVDIIGLAFLMSGISFEVLWVKFIIYENRFTGLYANPNVLGFTCVCAVFCCHLLTKKDFIAISGRERVSRIWIAACLAFNTISLLLSDSLGALVFLLFYAVFFLVYKMFGSERKFSVKQVIVKAVSMTLVGVIMVGSLYVVRLVMKKGFSDVMDALEYVSESVEEDEAQEMLSAAAGITFSHENKNIDSGRLKLWRQATSLFSDFPIFGIGKGNVYAYGENKFDNGIAFSDLYGDWLGQFTTDFHNGYAMILVCSGIVGFVIFFIFGLKLFKHTVVYVFKKENLSETVFPAMFSFLCAYLVYAFYEKALLYDISFTVMFFWMILGYVSCFLVRFEPDNRESFYIFKKRLRRSFI